MRRVNHRIIAGDEDVRCNGKLYGVYPTADVGDTSNADLVKCCLNYDMSEIPAEAVELEAATLNQKHGTPQGSPWESLGAVLIQPVTYDNVATCLSAQQADYATALFAADDPDEVQVDVSAWAQSAFADPEGHNHALRVRMGLYDAFSHPPSRTATPRRTASAWWGARGAMC